MSTCNVGHPRIEWEEHLSGCPLCNQVRLRQIAEHLRGVMENDLSRVSYELEQLQAEYNAQESNFQRSVNISQYRKDCSE